VVGGVAVVVAHAPGFFRGVVSDDDEAEGAVAQLLCQAPPADAAKAAARTEERGRYGGGS
jgi:hypothetical protein